MTVDQLDPTPIYEQLARIIRERIRVGDLKERQTVPSESSLQQEHGIARGSVRRAMELLREEGWVITIQGRGTFVAPREKWPEQG
ncbi:GntR family transcriptional regulator [Nonomuraea sp. NPDC050783]|uniref:GntR family transcriptional regulator n=1 Tax=Nonomuraea sp. NPDC050783 TaxID=3154634 RepID=UPI0034674B41